MKAKLHITATMLDKSIIDATESVREFAKPLGFDYEKRQAGDKDTHEATYEDGTPSRVSFYKAKTRGDKRVSIGNLRKLAKEGQTILLAIKRGKIVISVQD